MTEPFEPDEHELGGLLREALAVPARPLSRGQAAALLERLSARPRAAEVTLVPALGLAAFALLALVAWSLLQPPGPRALRLVGLIALAANVGLGPLSAAAILWRRRRAHVS
jgi:hypothetical protein